MHTRKHLEKQTKLKRKRKRPMRWAPLQELRFQISGSTLVVIPPFFARNSAGCRLALFGYQVVDPDNHRLISNLVQMREKLRYCAGNLVRS